jgi:hypothetical protein
MVYSPLFDLHFQDDYCVWVKSFGFLRMDARCELRRIVAVLFGVEAWCLHVSADSVYTYEGDLNLQISAELDTSKGCRANAEERQGRKIVLI